MISPTTQPSGPAPTAPAAPATPSGQSGLTSDFETFLKMLTAQAMNQDPLEPLDSSEYASQLAQFSMVEQQVLTNDRLAALSGANGMSSLAGWVGMEARAETPVFFDGAPVRVSPAPAKAADQMVLVVQNERGQEVQRTTLPASSAPLEWAGVDADGTPFPPALYSFSIESLNAGVMIETGPAGIYSQIQEAQINQGQVTLILQNGQSVPATSITALRQP